MSEKKPNWADKVSLASNVLQNIQLHGVHSRLRDLGNLEAEKLRLTLNEQEVAKLEDRLREHQWQLEQSFNSLLNNPSATPCGVFIWTKQIQSAMADFGINTSCFRDFADKDRLGNLISRIQQASRDAETKMTPRQLADARLFLQYEMDVRDLTELIELETAHQSVRQAQLNEEKTLRRIEELRQKKEAIHIGYGKTAAQRFMFLGLPFVLAFVVAIVGARIMEMTDVEDIQTMGMSSFLLGMTIGVLVLGALFAAIFRLAREHASPASKAAYDYQAEIDRLVLEIKASRQSGSFQIEKPGSEQKRMALKAKYPARDVFDLVGQKQKREAFIKEFKLLNEAAVDSADDPQIKLSGLDKEFRSE